MGKTSADAKPTPSEATKAALIEAGMKLFGEHGFEATSTRMLSDHAGVNLSAIAYHFQGKWGLYKAIMDHIGDRINSQLGDMSDLEEIFGNLVQVFAASDEPRAWALVVIREQVKPSETFGRIYERVIRPVQGRLAELLSARLGKPPQDPEVKLRAHALLGQVLIFLSSRESILRQLGKGSFEAEDTELIRRIILEHVRACLEVSS